MVGDFDFPRINWPIKKPLDAKDGTSLFVDFLLDSNLVQLVSKPTRFRSGQTPSTLSLVLTNDKHLISNLTLSAPIGKSDHSTIKFNIQTLHQDKPKYVLKPVNKINFTNLKLCLSSRDWSDILDAGDPRLA